MAAIEWQMAGVELGACICDWGCPCQFGALPTSGTCGGIWFMQIEEGWFGDVRLDGLVWAGVTSFPGAMHEGNGAQQFYVAQAASDAQLAALDAILTGREAEEGSLFQIFSSVTPHKQPTVRGDIAFACDPGARTGTGRVAGMIEVTVGPIRNPVTGAPQRAQIALPDGFEFRTAEMASSTFRAFGPIAVEAADKYAHIARVRWNRRGFVD
jgi:hypothetical protein